MIVIEPLGGLGNQLFVYGLGLANARRLGVSVVVDLRSISHDKKRRFELPTFWNSLDEHATPFLAPDGPRFQWHRIVAGRIGTQGRYRSLHYETHAGFDERFLSVSDHSRLRGYFQSWKYLESVQSCLRKQLWDLRDPSSWFSKQSSNLVSLGNWIGVHVRLGDYKDIQGMRLSDIYYERALALLASMGPVSQVVVFSDEIELARKMGIWRKFPSVIFMETPREASPIESMLLMSLASQLVVANSTFSWWSGWLGNRDGRTVIYPRPWGNGVFENRDLIPPNWIGVGREI
jgi:hypothetical protein